MGKLSWPHVNMRQTMAKCGNMCALKTRHGKTWQNEATRAHLKLNMAGCMRNGGPSVKNNRLSRQPSGSR